MNRRISTDYQALRQRMVKEQLIGRGIRDQRVLDAMEKVPRHCFVEEALRDRAYGDYPLPIGEHQTISQPYMVALMSEALSLKGDERILEIGTGSGYQTAVLAELAKVIYSIERLQTLALKARLVLDSLGYYQVVTRICDGTYGWPEEAPFDGIIVTAASPSLPHVLVDQLVRGGVMVVPIGNELSQDLIRVVKRDSGLDTLKLTPCVFVRLIGEYGGWQN